MENTWNDGVTVLLTDLDADAPGQEVLVLFGGTDVSFDLTVLRSDCRSFDVVAEVSGGYPALFTDGRGTLWYQGWEAAESDFPWVSVALDA